MAGSLVAIAVIGVGGYFALRSVAIDEAKGDTRDRALAEGRLAEAAGLRDGILRGDKTAVRRLDDLVLGQIVGGTIVRVKLWSKRGKVLYSDEPALIGQTYPLDEGKRRLAATWPAPTR